MERYGIVGFGCAGYHGAKSLRANGYTGVIDVYTDTGMAPENPMLTTYVTAGRLPETGAYPFGTLEEISRELRLNIHAQRVEQVEPLTRTVTSGGTARNYDKLLIATGANAFVPPVEGRESPNVYTMRTMRDARSLRERLDQGRIHSAVVVGASMVGIKIVELLRQRGIACTLSDLAEHIFPTAAFDSVAEEIERRLAEQGAELAFGKGLAGLADQPEGGVTVRLSDGSSLNCDLAVLCIGTRPNLGFLEKDALEMGRGGLRVDDHMATSAPGVYAAGDCAEHRNIQSGQPQAVGLWANAGRQGDVAGAAMAGRRDVYEGSLVHNITHFMGMDFISLGDKRLGGEHRVFSHRADGLWLEALVANGRLNCVNILDSHEISGIVKGMLMKQLRGEMQADIFLLEKLRRSGVDEAFIKLLEGEQHD